MLARVLMALAVLVAGALVLADLVQAQPRERSGEEVVKMQCVKCHGAGVDGAPRIGDKEAWAKRAARGLSSLTASALAGIRKMPAHGGEPSITDDEITRAITVMVNKSGGNWVEPIGRSARRAERSGEEIVKMQCVKCHGEGVGGAPKIDDRAAWAARMKQGLDATVRSAAHGHGAMPARGGLAEITDAELRAAILYMFYPAAAALKPRDSVATPRDPHHKKVGGIDFYLGIAPAATVPANLKGPRGKGYYYVNVSLHDGVTQAFIKDAQVEARAANPVMGGETKKLESVTLNDAASYGAFFRMEGAEPYTITVRVRRPGDDGRVETSFEFKP